MRLDQIHSVYFLGIGGIGMSALARWFNQRGTKVYGYDRTPTSLTESLLQEGIELSYEDSVADLPKAIDLVVWTPAIPSSNQLRNALEQSEVPMIKRAELLGMISREYRTYAAAGTHGKTTTTSMIAHLASEVFGGVQAFVGGIMANSGSNFLSEENPRLCVVEADEFDRSFLRLDPNLAIVTSVDADHLDIYGSQEQFEEGFNMFAAKVKDALIVKEGIQLTPKNTAKLYTYAIDSETADFSAANLRVEDGAMLFDLRHPNGVMSDLRLTMPGIHNVENAVASLALMLIEGASEVDLRPALESYRGVKRRFERIVDGTTSYIDDYAHHPTELKAAISSARMLFPERRIMGVFQPHLFSRTRDFMEAFALELSGLDQVRLLDIYPARELPIEGVTSEVLLEKINTGDKKLVAAEDLLEEVRTNRPEVIMTLGAGDIDRLVQPLKEILEA